MYALFACTLFVHLHAAYWQVPTRVKRRIDLPAKDDETSAAAATTGRLARSNALENERVADIVARVSAGQDVGRPSRAKAFKSYVGGVPK